MSLTNWQVYSNAGALQSLVHTVCKSPSKSDHEFNIKYDVYQSLMKSYTRWGHFGQAVAFSGVLYVCLKGTSPPKKIGAAFLFIYWINHFFTVSSFVGICTRLPWAIKQLNVEERYYLRKQMDKVHELILNRQDESDQDITNEFYKFDNKTQLADNPLVENDYFFKHPEYAKSESFNYKLKYFDAYLTRYCYFTFRNWTLRFMGFLGIIQ
ncbi:hypothetical protein pb186bvf_014034 [Paramecium bursaria]